MAFEIRDSSGDVVVEAHAAAAGQGLVELARGYSAVVAGSVPSGGSEQRPVAVHARDLKALAVGFVNELVFLFTDEKFLPTGGTVKVLENADGARAEGELTGVLYDPDRHGSGVEVKAATYHDVRFEQGVDGWTVGVLLDL